MTTPAAYESRDGSDSLMKDPSRASVDKSEGDGMPPFVFVKLEEQSNVDETNGTVIDIPGMVSESPTC